MLIVCTYVLLGNIHVRGAHKVLSLRAPCTYNMYYKTGTRYGWAKSHATSDSCPNINRLIWSFPAIHTTYGQQLTVENQMWRDFWPTLYYTHWSLPFRDSSSRCLQRDIHIQDGQEGQAQEGSRAGDEKDSKRGKVGALILGHPVLKLCLRKRISQWRRQSYELNYKERHSELWMKTGDPVKLEEEPDGSRGQRYSFNFTFRPPYMMYEKWVRQILGIRSHSFSGQGNFCLCFCSVSDLSTHNLGEQALRASLVRFFERNRRDIVVEKESIMIVQGRVFTNKQ